MLMRIRANLVDVFRHIRNYVTNVCSGLFPVRQLRLRSCHPANHRRHASEPSRREQTRGSNAGLGKYYRLRDFSAPCLKSCRLFNLV